MGLCYAAGMWRRGPVAGLLSGLLTLSCVAPEPPPVPTGDGFEPRPTRGVILISLDTVRADHLSCYGYERRTTPFLESLAERSVLFERAVAQYPSTLISHMSMFTGFYPRQHGVFPPAAVLSPEIETMPERLQAAGLRTAGHTEGGYVSGAYGFERGFEEFTDTPYADDTDVERTFERGLATTSASSFSCTPTRCTIRTTRRSRIATPSGTASRSCRSRPTVRHCTT